MTNTLYSKNALIEQLAIALFEVLGWSSSNCFYEKSALQILGIS